MIKFRFVVADTGILLRQLVPLAWKLQAQSLGQRPPHEQSD